MTLSGAARTPSPPRGLGNSLEKENLPLHFSAQLNPTNVSWAPTASGTILGAGGPSQETKAEQQTGRPTGKRQDPQGTRGGKGIRRTAQWLKSDSPPTRAECPSGTKSFPRNRREAENNFVTEDQQLSPSKHEGPGSFVWFLIRRRCLCEVVSPGQIRWVHVEGEGSAQASTRGSGTVGGRPGAEHEGGPSARPSPQ